MAGMPGRPGPKGDDVSDFDLETTNLLLLNKYNLYKHCDLVIASKAIDRNIYI